MNKLTRSMAKAQASVACLGISSDNVAAALAAFAEAVGLEQFEKCACYRFAEKGEFAKARNQIIVMGRKPYMKAACEHALELWDGLDYDTSFIDEFRMPVYDWGVVV